jgi:hypothetical protein
MIPLRDGLTTLMVAPKLCRRSTFSGYMKLCKRDAWLLLSLVSAKLKLWLDLLSEIESSLIAKGREKLDPLLWSE